MPRIAALAAAAGVTGLFILPMAVPGVSRAQGALLGNEDCVKCHGALSAELKLSGAAHEEVNCSGCHPGHPPRSKVDMPQCRKCHDGEPHFDKQSCGSCHTNPHMPLQIVMPSDSSEPCRECHASQVALIDRGSSLHSEVSCYDCHGSHRQVPVCRDCHDSHVGGEEDQDCVGCHDPHLPSPVVFNHRIADSDCAPCHREALDLLRANTTGHSRRSCVSCHQRRHGTLPLCSTCHGLPHRLGGNALFAECGECHSTAHDLSVWPEGNP